MIAAEHAISENKGGVGTNSPDQHVFGDDRARPDAAPLVGSNAGSDKAVRTQPGIIADHDRQRIQLECRALIVMRPGA